MAARCMPRGTLLVLTERPQAHKRFLRELRGWRQLHQGEQTWIELEIGANLLSPETIIGTARVTVRDADNVLWRARVVEVHESIPQLWRLGPWSRIGRTTTHYHHGVTLRLGFHQKHLRQLP
jgi:hypothetical protein